MLTSRQAATSTAVYTNGVPSGGGSSTTPEEKFVWDTLSSIPTLLEDRTDNFVYGTSSAPLAQIDKTTGTVEYLHGDERGSIIAASLENGSYSWYQIFDEYGYESDKVAQTNVSQVSTRFAYAGEYQDSTTGLYNLRARWYEPETASFLNIDPALGMTGEAYSYASANPLAFTDPLGLWSEQNSWNSAMGFLDGITGIPVASTISNLIAPGSVQLCSTEYGVSFLVGSLVSLFIPGGWIKTVLTLNSKLKMVSAAKTAVGVKKVDIVADAEKALAREWKKAESLPYTPTGSTWKVGDNTYSGFAAEHKLSRTEFSKVASRHWKNQASNPDRPWDSIQLARMKNGNAPQRLISVKNKKTGKIEIKKESMELSHEDLPLREGGRRYLMRWPGNHAQVDKYRNVPYNYMNESDFNVGGVG